MLWTANQLEEWVWGLNYVVILDFCLLWPSVCPLELKVFNLEKKGLPKRREKEEEEEGSGKRE